MESYASHDLKDYWNEVRTIGRQRFHSVLSEKDSRSQDDEFESHLAFLEDYGICVDSGKEIEEDRHLFSKYLTPKQEEVIRRRIRTYNASHKRKQRRRSPRPHVKDLFIENQTLSNDTRSRSATPDSLDSDSPPLTPSNDLLSNSRASLDSGNHSLVTAPTSSLPYTSTPPTYLNSQGLEDNQKLRVSPWDRDPRQEELERYLSTPEENDDGLSRNVVLKDVVGRPFSGLRRHQSNVRDLARDVRLSYLKQGSYEFHGKTDAAGDQSAIQVLAYKNIGSIHIPHIDLRDYRYLQELQSSNSSSSEFSSNHDLKDSFDKTKKKQEDSDKDHRSRFSAATDLGFKSFSHGPGDEWPELQLEVGRSGLTRIDWLDESDLQKLKSLALVELDILFTEYDIRHRWRKWKRKKVKEMDTRVFGASLEALVESDKNNWPETSHMEHNVPLVFYKVVNQLQLKGLEDVGILRVPGHRARTEYLKKTISSSFYSSSNDAREAIKSASTNELVSIMKAFLRELPEPLLTHAYMPAFFKTNRIPNLGERIFALTMLVILLPKCHRDTLKLLLDLCTNITLHEGNNKMGLYNVSMIMAPNLLLPQLCSAGKSNSRNSDASMNNEMEYASATTRIVQCMIRYKDILWTVPHRLIAQIRQQNQTQRETSNPMQRFLLRKSREVAIERPITNEVDYQDGILRVTAPQFKKFNFPVKLNSLLTPSDILRRFIEEQVSVAAPGRVAGRRERRSAHRTSSDAASLKTCLLRGSVSHALDNHALHERGGNIGERRLDPKACLLAIYQDNPNAEFVVKCHHPGGFIES